MENWISISKTEYVKKMCLLMGLITGNPICTFYSQDLLEYIWNIYFFFEKGDFGRFCFNFSVSLCEQSMILLGMFYQQYILRQPNGTWYHGYSSNGFLPSLDSELDTFNNWPIMVISYPPSLYASLHSLALKIHK